MSDQTDKIKQLFIKTTLEKHSEELSELFIGSIKRKRLINSEDLIETIQGNPWKVHKRGEAQILSVEFANYGRFIEINQKKKIKTESRKANGKKFTKKRKNTSWYTKNVYGSQNLLIGRLMWGLSDIEMDRLKKILKKDTTR